MIKIKLEDQEFAIKFMHENNNNSAKTTAWIEYREDPAQWYKSVAFCHKNDNFNKKTGRKVAILKMLRKSGFAKKIRKSIWEQYFKQTNQNYVQNIRKR